MVATIVQSKASAQNTGLATVAATWDTAATAGNLLLLAVGADDYAASPPSGWTQSTGCKQETFLGHYVWWKVAAGGETSVNYTLGAAAPSCWITAEISGLEASPYDISAGQFVQSSGTTYTTPPITPTTGDRFIIASIGGSLGSAGLTDLNTWLNSFTEIRDVFTTLASGTRDLVGFAASSVTANGSTDYSSGATYNATAQARTGIIIAFKVAAAGGGTVQGVGTANLGGLTASAAGGRRVSGTAAAPLGALTATAAGDRIVNGSATAALGGLTSSAAGDRTVNGSAAGTLGALTVTAVGDRRVSGTATAGLGALGATVVGRRTIHGTLAASLGGLTATATGEGASPAVIGTGQALLGGLTAAAAGRRTVRAFAAVDLGALAATVAGLRTVHGHATGVLGGLTATATVGFATTGTGPRIVSRSAPDRVVSRTEPDRITSQTIGGYL